MSKSFNLSHDQSAFSLIELMIILAIIGILAAVTAPNILGMLPRMRLKNAVNRIVTDIQLARMKSIATGKEYRLNFDISSESYSIEEGNRSSSSTSWNAGVEEERKFGDSNNLYYHKGIDIHSVDINPVFTPKGLSNNTTVIKLKDSTDNKKRISINIAGRIKTYEGWE